MALILMFPYSTTFLLFMFVHLIVLVSVNFFILILIFILLHLDYITFVPLIALTDSTLTSLFPKTIAKTADNIRKSLLVKTHGADLNLKRGIYIFHPHGLFSLCQFFHIGSDITDWPIRKIVGVSHNLMSEVPIVKDFTKYNGRSIPSHYSTMKASLLEDKSISITLGGYSEAKYNSPTKMVLNIKNKKGIFKMALQTGTPLVPVITYRENQTCVKAESFITRFLDKHIKLSPQLPTLETVSKWINLTEKPLEAPMLTYIGKPVSAELIEKPTDTEIIELREKYFKALETLYAETRPKEYESKLYII